MNQKIKTILKSILLLAMIVVSVQAFAGWSNPPAGTPPNTSPAVEPPINTSKNPQSKDGSLAVRGLKVWQSAQFESAIGVNGLAQFNSSANFNSSAIFNSSIKITQGTQLGTPKVLTDVNGDGNATWQPIGTAVTKLNTIFPADATNGIGIDNLNYKQEWKWNSLAGNTGLKLSSSSALAASNSQKLFEVALGGANNTANQTTYGAFVTNAHTLSSSTPVGPGQFSATNVAGYFSASNGERNYALLTGTGYVGIGDLTPASLFTVGSGDKFQISGTGTITSASLVGTGTRCLQVGADGLISATDSACATTTPPPLDIPIWEKDQTTGFIFPRVTNIPSRVGIGISTPTELLHVEGNALVAGILKGSLGTEVAPSYTFAGDLNTGMWSPGADKLAFSTNGYSRLEIDNLGGITIPDFADGTQNDKICADLNGKLKECDSNFTSDVTRAILFNMKKGPLQDDFSIEKTQVLYTTDPSDIGRQVIITNSSYNGTGYYRVRATYRGISIGSEAVVSATLVTKNYKDFHKLTMNNTVSPDSEIEFHVSDDASANDMAPGDEIHFMVSWPTLGNP